MYHISANLAFSDLSTRKKYLGVQKASGGQEAYKKNRKKVATVKKLWGWQKISRGAPNGIVTPLRTGCYMTNDI